MSLSEEQKKMESKIEALEEKALIKEMIEYNAGKNTKETRSQYMRLVHYYHILNQMGVDGVDEHKENIAFSLLKEKITKMTDKERQRKEIIQVNLINAHTNSFNLAEYFYEKASKSLCQMMITLMDYILQEKADMSVLYTAETESHRSFFSLLDEIQALNEDYLESYFFLCAYDYCTEKISDYMEIKEYKKLIKEHIRIIENGIPARVSHTMQILNDIVAEDEIKAEIFIDINRAYVPEPPYNEELLEKCYQEVLTNKYDNNIDLAMSEFGNFVIALDTAYANCF